MGTAEVFVISAKNHYLGALYWLPRLSGGLTAY